DAVEEGGSRLQCHRLAAGVVHIEVDAVTLGRSAVSEDPVLRVEDDVPPFGEGRYEGGKPQAEVYVAVVGEEARRTLRYLRPRQARLSVVFHPRCVREGLLPRAERVWATAREHRRPGDTVHEDAGEIDQFREIGRAHV